MPKETQSRMLRHVAIIPDGNRRWARAKGLPEIMGHEQGLKNLIPLLDIALKFELDILTFWGFSTENARRSALEVKLLMTIFERFAREYGPKLEERNIRFRAFGRLDALPTSLQKVLVDLERLTHDNTAMTVAVGLNYGGRDELLRGIQTLVARQLVASQITPALIRAALDLPDVVDPDLIIRTSGEQRLSGFMPWQAVYSELAFPTVNFPDFSPAVFGQILEKFADRQRRFGK